MAVTRRWAAAALCVLSLSACGAAYEPDRFWNDATFWQEGKASEAAMAALSKGDFVRAEQAGNEAMHRNPKDPYAILALAVVYENTSRGDLARQYFQALASMNPQATALVGVGPTTERRTIADIAQQHLSMLGGRPNKQGSVAPPPAVSGNDIGASDDANLILRFQTLRHLLDEGLITREEYNQRRGANLGALLPYTAPAPAAGLGRAAPTPEQVAERLRFLASAFEEKSISAREQSVERAAILDALLPAGAAVRKADPPNPLTDQMQAAAAVGRLEKLKAAYVITGDEQSREKTAVFRAVQTYQAQAEAAARAAAGLEPAISGSPTGPGVRLASYRSESQALHAWAALQKAHPDELGSLRPQVTKVSLRRRGALYRLSAGPVTDRKAALVLCRNLKRHRLACEPTVLAK